MLQAAHTNKAMKQKISTSNFLNHMNIHLHLLIKKITNSTKMHANDKKIQTENWLIKSNLVAIKQPCT